VTGTLEGGRITHAARSVGVSQAALEAALRYAQERVQFGQPIAKFQAIKFKLARMAAEGGDRAHHDVARRLALSTRALMREAAMAKLFASEVAQRVDLGSRADLRRLWLQSRSFRRAVLA